MVKFIFGMNPYQNAYAGRAKLPVDAFRHFARIQSCCPALPDNAAMRLPAMTFEQPGRPGQRSRIARRI
jgi:hypothetical protein